MAENENLKSALLHRRKEKENNQIYIYTEM